MTGHVLPHGRRLKIGLAMLALASIARSAPAEQFTLADLLDNPDATFRSHDGRIEFSDFELTTRSGAGAFPSNESVRVLPTAAATGGFMLEGPFQALNGVNLAGTLSFTARTVEGLGFDRAWLRLGTPSAYGFSASRSQPSEAAFVSLVETLRAIEGEAQHRLTTMHDATGDGSVFVSSPLNPDLFGSELRISQDLEMQSVRGQGPSVSILSSYIFGLTVVPEPGTALLLLAAGGLCLTRLRRRRMA